MPPKSHRRACHVEVCKLVESLDLLPFGAVKTGEVVYPEKNMKKAPLWSRAQKFVPVLSSMMTHSHGRCVLHLSMRAGVVAWSQKHDLGLSEVLVDEVAYSLRAITSQLMNMKKKRRAVPTKWASKFQVLHDKLRPEDESDNEDAPCASTDDRSKTIAVHAICDHTVHVVDDESADIVEVEDSSSDLPDRMDLFDSDNPELKKILTVKRRVWGKSFRPEYDVPMPDQMSKAEAMSIDDIEMLAEGAAPDAAELGPRAWAGLNKKLKKNDKKTQPKAASKAMKTCRKETSNKVKVAANASEKVPKVDFAYFVRKEHSKVYHKQVAQHVKAGLPKEMAKLRAQESARACAAELRQLRAEGRFPEYD